MEDKPESSKQESCAPAPVQEALSREVPPAEPRPIEVKADVADNAPQTAAPGEVSSIPQDELNRMTDDMISAIKTVYDPEIPVDIFELGLIYKIDVDDDRSVAIDMTLTAPGCPVAGEMPGWVEDAVRTVEGVSDVKVELVFDPPWDISRMSDEARVALNMW